MANERYLILLSLLLCAAIATTAQQQQQVSGNDTTASNSTATNNSTINNNNNNNNQNSTTAQGNANSTSSSNNNIQNKIGTTDQANSDNNNANDEDNSLDGNNGDQDYENDIPSNENTTGLIEIITDVGAIRGKESPQDWNAPAPAKHYQFLGIPYAEPPVGPLRFRDPVPRRPFSRPFNATKFGPSCPQTGESDGSVPSSLVENCLTLNIYTPRVPSRRGRVPDQSSLLPVMIWVHWGKFRYGSGAAVDPAPLVQQGVIVVTLNYRLGVFGFLTLDDPMISGNQGLKDQLEAFKWVSRNIMAFGGNPSKVTLFGGGAGGASVHLHQLSPKGQNLYQGVIVQSNSALTLSQTLRKGTGVADSRRFVTDAGCDSSDGNAVLQCLQEKTTQDLLNSTLANYDVTDELSKELNGTGGYYFGPVLDADSLDPFLPEHPLTVLTRGSQKDIPVIAGVNQNEGSETVSSIWNVLPDVAANWTLFGPRFIFASKAGLATEEEQLKANVTRHFYAGTQNFSQLLKQELTDMFSDAQFVSPMLRAVELQSKSQQEPVYLYQMTHKPSRSRVEKYGKSTGANTEDFGAAHGDELMLLFASVDNVTDAISSPDDEAARERMTTLWTNFAKHQDPTPFQEEGVPAWMPYQAEAEKYLEIKPLPEVREGLVHKDRMYFWRKIYWEDLENPAPVTPSSPVLYQLNNQGASSPSKGAAAAQGQPQQGASLPYPYTSGFGGFPNRQAYPNGFFG